MAAWIESPMPCHRKHSEEVHCIWVSTRRQQHTPGSVEYEALNNSFHEEVQGNFFFYRMATQCQCQNENDQSQPSGAELVVTMDV